MGALEPIGLSVGQTGLGQFVVRRLVCLIAKLYKVEHFDRVVSVEVFEGIKLRAMRVNICYQKPSPNGNA